MNDNYEKQLFADTFHYKIRVLIGRYREKLKILAKDFDGLPGQHHILVILSKQNECYQGQLCKILNVKPASMTDMLQRMEKSELVIRKQDEFDMRITRVCITDKGLTLVSQFEKMGRESEDACFKGFSVEEKQTFFLLLDRLNENLKSDKIDKVNERRCLN